MARVATNPLACSGEVAFSRKNSIYAGPDLLGGKEEFIDTAARTLERLGMLKPPRATDLRISALGREVIPDGLKRGQMYGLVPLGPKGWHVEGFALASRGRSADTVLLACRIRQASGLRWRRRARLARRNIFARACEWIGNFWPCRRQRSVENGQLILPGDAFGNLKKGVLRAWAMDYGDSLVSASRRSAIHGRLR